MLRWITALLAVLVLASSYLSYSQHNDLVDARAQLQATQQRADSQLVINEQVVQHAAELAARADSAEAVVDTVIIRAEAADVELAAAPTVRDSLTAAVTARDAYRTAFHAQVAASAALRARGDSLASANADLARVVSDYGDASQGILDATKPSFIDGLIPEIGVGCTAGIDPITRDLGAACGPTMTWRF